MLHLPTAIVRWETPASFLFPLFTPLFTPNQPPVSGRRRSELPLSITVTHSTRQECLVHTEYEILIFLYFQDSRWARYTLQNCRTSFHISRIQQRWMRLPFGRRNRRWQSR